MKSEKQIKEKLKKLDAIETFNYGNSAPMSEWAMHQDLGWRAALKWVLKDGYDKPRK